MSKAHSNEDYRRLKMLSYQVKATTYLKSETKNNFMSDCIKRDVSEGQLLRDIVSLHYETVRRLGVSDSLEFSELLDKFSKNKY